MNVYKGVAFTPSFLLASGERVPLMSDEQLSYHTQSSAPAPQYVVPGGVVEWRTLLGLLDIRTLDQRSQHDSFATELRSVLALQAEAKSLDIAVDQVLGLIDASGFNGCIVGDVPERLITILYQRGWFLHHVTIPPDFVAYERTPSSMEAVGRRNFPALSAQSRREQYVHDLGGMHHVGFFLTPKLGLKTLVVVAPFSGGGDFCRMIGAQRTIAPVPKCILGLRPANVFTCDIAFYYQSEEAARFFGSSFSRLICDGRLPRFESMVQSKITRYRYLKLGISRHGVDTYVPAVIITLHDMDNNPADFCFTRVDFDAGNGTVASICDDGHFWVTHSPAADPRVPAPNSVTITNMKVGLRFPGASMTSVYRLFGGIRPMPTFIMESEEVFFTEERFAPAFNQSYQTLEPSVSPEPLSLFTVAKEINLPKSESSV